MTTQVGSLISVSAQGAGTLNSADQNNIHGRGLKVVIDITVTGTLSMTVAIQGKDPISGKYYTMLISAALTSVATTVLTLFPGATASANVVANDQLPTIWRVQAVVGGGAPNATFTIAASLLD